MSLLTGPLYLLLVSLLALVLDRVFGEPRIHPLIWFGALANLVEKTINQQNTTPFFQFVYGLISLVLIVAPIVAVVLWLTKLLEHSIVMTIAFETMVLWFVIGWQSLKEHATNVSDPLLAGNLDSARGQLAMIVSRDTAQLTEQQVAGSTLESVLENGHDSLFASLFWNAVLGPAGAILHRLVNTLDAMWGYRTERYEYFGKTAARLDDMLGYFPARLTAISYALAGA
ncbi:MAG: adenosylcobinamide-phosphate synthase CbiB, partial [Granulosicoccus sp.]|nr:adenosylcobinamide-phosphate synthase CbiB [Granulosicoccus sp.]